MIFRDVGLFVCFFLNKNNEIKMFFLTNWKENIKSGKDLNAKLNLLTYSFLILFIK